MSGRRFDVIVLGTGGVGSAAAYHLARRGLSVLGLDRFPAAHAHGSSHGETRIIRKAYFEHADYVPLLERAYVLWRELEAESAETLYRDVGLVECGPADGIVIPGVLSAARRHNLPVEELSSSEFGSRFPFRLAEDQVAVFERDAGFLYVEHSVLAYLTCAQRHGAELVTGETVRAWYEDGSGIAVETDRGAYRAERLVITAGAWATTLLADLGVPLRIRRKHLHWYACGDPSYHADNGCPGFFFENDEGYFYGFPQINDEGVKVSEHSGGVTVGDPLRDDKGIEPADRARVEQFLAANLPDVSRRPTRHEVCYYTMSPDEHFVVDRHPAHDNVVFAAGLSGHGYKFASVLGEVLTELVVDGAARLPIGFLGCDRFR